MEHERCVEAQKGDAVTERESAEPTVALEQVRGQGGVGSGETSLRGRCI